jgi:hypothetical protein
MPLHVIANGSVGWSIEDTSAHDAYLLFAGDGRYVLDATATGGAWITRDAFVSYAVDAAGQPAVTLGAERFTVGAGAQALNLPTYAGQTLYITNTHVSAAADLGGPAVTGGAGLALAAAASVTLTLKPGDVVYAVRSASTDVTLTVFRT